MNTRNPKSCLVDVKSKISINQLHAQVYNAHLQPKHYCITDEAGNALA